LVTKDGHILATKRNGTLPGRPNRCEDEHGKTHHDRVLHAEQNIITFCAKTGISMEGAHLFVTTAPCELCATLLSATGIVKVVYGEVYKNSDGLKVLTDSKIDHYSWEGL
jgi:dCMP deaminase